MKSNITLPIILSFMLAFASACGSLAIKGVDYAQPVEMVMQASNSGQVSDARTGLSFNVSPLLEEEGLRASDFAGTEVRMIRNHQGYYFLTAAGFRNVYVLESHEKELRSKRALNVGGDRLQNPVFNQRNPNVQLIDGNRSYNLTSDGISQ